MGKCKNCGNCCNHVAMEIDKPTTKEEYQQILWFLLHKGIKVFVDEDNEWYVEFPAQCEWRKDNKCMRHEDRPAICKEYSSNNCVMNGEGDGEKFTFDTYDDFKRWLEERDIDYRYKWQKVK